MLYNYPATIIAERDGGFSVVFKDVPEAITQGETRAEALVMAEDALTTALSFYVEDGRALPPPSNPQGEPLVAPPPLAAAKLALHVAMLAAGLSSVQLAERLGIDEKAVRRLRDPLHRSDIGAIEQALRALGRRLVLQTQDVAA